MILVRPSQWLLDNRASLIEEVMKGDWRRALPIPTKKALIRAIKLEIAVAQKGGWKGKVVIDT